MSDYHVEAPKGTFFRLTKGANRYGSEGAILQLRRPRRFFGSVVLHKTWIAPHNIHEQRLSLEMKGLIQEYNAKQREDAVEAERSKFFGDYPPKKL